MPWLDQLINLINNLGPANYWLALAVALLESLVIVGAVIPGSIILIIIAALAVQTTLNPWLLILYASLGSIIGDGISYWLGTKGTKFFKHQNKLLKKSHLDKSERYFKKHGNLSVFLGRFAGPIRPMIPFVAGLSKMRPPIFYFWNITGAVLWAVSHVFLGYFFGGTVSLIATWADRLGFIIFITLAAAILLGYALKKSRPLFRFLKATIGRAYTAVITGPEATKLIRRYPRISALLQKRLTVRNFTGLALTSLVLAFGYALFLLLDLLFQIKSDTLILASDQRLANLFFSLRDRETVHFFLWVTLLGKWQIVLAGALAFSIILWLWAKKKYIAPLWLTLIGAGVTDFLAKLVVMRQRPSVAYYLESGYSFPSGHATLAVAFYGFIVFVLWNWSKKWSRRVNLAITGALIIIAIGFSRLYLDVHYLSDVLGGYLAGLLFLLVGITLTLWRTHRRRSARAGGPACQDAPRVALPTPDPRLRRHKKIITAIVLVIYAALYIGLGLIYSPPANPTVKKEYQKTADVFGNFMTTQNKAAPSDRDKLSDRQPDTAPAPQLPAYTKTLLGRNQKPISLIIIAKNDQALVRAFKKAGWQPADKTRPLTVWLLARAALADQEYSTAPMSPSFWNTRPHDLGFEKPTTLPTVKKRHHARFWRTDLLTPQEQHVYVGTASLDIGLKWMITHKISPDLDSERELIVTDLAARNLIKNRQKKPLVPPQLGHNFGGDTFFTDGKIYLLEID